jgi:hypothetical protein
VAAKNHELLAVLPVPIGKGRANLRNPYYLQKQRCLESPLIGSRGRGGDCPRRAGSSTGRRGTGNRDPYPGLRKLTAIGQYDHITYIIQPEFRLVIREMHNAMSSAFKIFNISILTQCPDDQKHGVWQNLDWAHITIKAIRAPGGPRARISDSKLHRRTLASWAGARSGA